MIQRVQQMDNIERKQSLFFYQDQGQKEQSFVANTEVQQNELISANKLSQSIYSQQSFHAISKREMKSQNVESQLLKRRQMVDSMRITAENQRRDSNNSMISDFQNGNDNNQERSTENIDIFQQIKGEQSRKLVTPLTPVTPSPINQQRFLSKFHSNQSSPRTSPNRQRQKLLQEDQVQQSRRRIQSSFENTQTQSEMNEQNSQIKQDNQNQYENANIQQQLTGNNQFINNSQDINQNKTQTKIAPNISLLKAQQRQLSKNFVSQRALQVDISLRQKLEKYRPSQQNIGSNINIKDDSKQAATENKIGSPLSSFLPYKKQVSMHFTNQPNEEEFEKGLINESQKEFRLDNFNQQTGNINSFSSLSEDKDTSRNNSEKEIHSHQTKLDQFNNALDEFINMDEKQLNKQQSIFNEQQQTNKSSKIELFESQKYQSEILDSSSKQSIHSRNSIYNQLLIKRNQKPKKLDLRDYFRDYIVPVYRLKYCKIESTANPFTNNSILYKGLLKYNRTYLFCQVIFNFNEELMEKYFQKMVVNNNSKIILKFHGVTQKKNNIWESEIELSFKTFIRWFVGCEQNEFSYQKFRDNFGFNKHQLDSIRKNIDKLIYFNKSEAQVIFFQQNVYEKQIQNKKQKYLLNRPHNYVSQQNLLYAAMFDNSLLELMEIIKIGNPNIDFITNQSIMKSSTFMSDKRSMRLFKRLQKIQQDSNIEYAMKLQTGKKKIQKQFIERKIVLVKELYETAKRDNIARFQEHQFQSDIANSECFKILRGYNTIYTRLDGKQIFETKDFYFKIVILEKIISDRFDILQEEKVLMYVATKNSFQQQKRLYFKIRDPYIMDKVKNTVLFKSELNSEQFKYISNYLLTKLLKKTRSIHGIQEKIISFYKKSLVEDGQYSTFIDIFNQKTIEALHQFTYTNRQSIDYFNDDTQNILRELTNHLNLTFINQHLNDISENLKKVYFESITTQFFFRIQNDTYVVQSTAYRTKINLNLIPLCYIVLQIHPLMKQKTTSYKFIFNLSDLDIIFKSKLNHDTIFNINSLLHISQYVMKKVQKISVDHYSRFILPLKGFYPFNSNLKKLILINTFSVEVINSYFKVRIKLYTESMYLFFSFQQLLDYYFIYNIMIFLIQGNYQIDSKFNLSPLSSMKLEMNYMKVIYKGVSKVQGQFCILTIKQYQYLDYYQISIYFPISARKYSTFIYDQNIKQFTEEFMHGIIKYPTTIKNKKHGSFKDFEDAVIEEQINFSNNEEEPLDPKQFCQLINPNLQTDSLLLYHIWNRIAQKIQVRKNLQNFQIFELDNYYSVFHEQIFDKVIRVHNNDSILFEVFLENQNKKQIHKISDPFRNIDYTNTSQYILFIKINFFNRINQYNEKINLQNTLYTYYTENIEILLEDLKFIQKKKRQNSNYSMTNQDNYQNEEVNNINKSDFEDPILEREGDNVYFRFKGNHQNTKDQYSIDEILNSLEISQSKIYDAIIYISEKIQINYQILFMQEHASMAIKRSTTLLQSLFSKSFTHLSMSKITPSGNKMVNLARQLKYKQSIMPDGEMQSIDNSIQLHNFVSTPPSNTPTQQLINGYQNQMPQKEQKFLRVNNNKHTIFNNSKDNAIIEESLNQILTKHNLNSLNTSVQHQVQIPLVYTLQNGNENINDQSNNQQSNLNLNFVSGSPSVNNLSVITSKKNIQPFEDYQNLQMQWQQPQQLQQSPQKARILSRMIQTKRSLAISVNDNNNLSFQSPTQSIFNHNYNQNQVLNNNNNNDKDDNSQIYSNNLKVIETNIIKRDKRYKANIKTNSNLNMGIVENTLAKNYIILYRKLLMFKPLTFLSIIYCEKGQYIIFSTQNLKNCKDINIKYTLNQIEYLIPYATQMIENSLFQEIGERLYLAYKNRIIVTILHQMNE